MSSMPEDRGAAALLCPAGTGPAQPTMAEQPAPVGYKYSQDQDQAVAGSEAVSNRSLANSISVAEFLDRLLDSRLLSSDEVDRFLASQPGLLDSDTAGLVEAFVGHGL